MKLNTKDYKIIKTKNYLKTYNFLFFVNGINQSSLEWLITEQKLKASGFDYYKLLNKTTIKTLKSSIYTRVNSAVKGSTFFINLQLQKPFLKHIILNTLTTLFFDLLLFKFNNKTYSIKSLKKTHSLKYKEIQLLFYKFNVIRIKNCYTLSK